MRKDVHIFRGLAAYLFLYEGSSLFPLKVPVCEPMKNHLLEVGRGRQRKGAPWHPLQSKRAIQF